jgi:hypothetical protein
MDAFKKLLFLAGPLSGLTNLGLKVPLADGIDLRSTRRSTSFNDGILIDDAVLSGLPRMWHIVPARAGL